ncbi:polysaccharide lyase family 7 protein [Flammeovirga aprica]|uniref:Polysaccharide lyase family 7 protein n=1 Tax=Flammeovirga aprica JL-4 TaxID=694437 RepID=A0A7X9XA37_9BACT|nr:polysaccharide lyase family 7 protein [Flammeovirga aprica]NME69281.1 polysaccharide lyase family 7 protein [Flammeovirga aprica JL-4]
MNRLFTLTLLSFFFINAQCKSDAVEPSEEIEEIIKEVDDELTEKDTTNTTNEDTVTVTPDYNLPFVILNLNNWKLNAFEGELDNLEYVDRISDLANYSNEHWFYSSAEDWVTFKCYAGFPTSSGSGNPRTELRELESDGKTNSYWDGTKGTHQMEWEVNVEHLPSSGKLCFGQIHGPSDSYDDVIRVQFQGDKNQGEGDVRLKIMGWVTEENGDFSGDFIDGDWALDTVYRFRLIFENENLILYSIVNEEPIEIYRFEGCGSTENYFKAGLYMQSMQNKPYNLEDYGQVSMSYLSVTHQ